MASDSTRDFYDDLAPDHHLIFPDDNASCETQLAAQDIERAPILYGPRTRRGRG